MGCPTPLDCKGLKFGELIYNILDHITAMVFQAFWAEEHGFLENRQTGTAVATVNVRDLSRAPQPPRMRSLFIHKKENLLQ